AAHGDGEGGLSLLRVQGQGEGQQVLQAAHVVLGLWEVEHIVRHRLVQPRPGTQVLHIEGIRHEPHVKHQIRLQRQAVLEAEGGDAHCHPPLLPLLAEEAQQLSPQLGGGGAGGVDDKVRPLLDGGHHGPLLLHRLLQGVGVCRQGMAAAGLLVPLDDDLRRGLQKQHPALGLHVLQLIQHVEQLREGAGRPHVVHQGHPVVAAVAPGAELRKFQDHGGGHIVHDIKAHVLQKGGRLALPGPGEAGDDEDFHVRTAPFSVDDPDLRLQPDAGLRKDPLLDLADQLLHVGAGGAAPVDDKARMLLADLGAAHRQPLQAALVDQRPGVIALRPLEGAA
ncbi:V-type sodium pump subunit C, partial [Dysosmobacter welbionis]